CRSWETLPPNGQWDRQSRPAVLLKQAASCLEALWGFDPTLFKPATLGIAAAVQGQQLLLGELGTDLQSGPEQVGVDMVVLWQLRQQLWKSQKLVSEEVELLQWCLVLQHLLPLPYWLTTFEHRFALLHHRHDAFTHVFALDQREQQFVELGERSIVTLV